MKNKFAIGLLILVIFAAVFFTMAPTFFDADRKTEEMAPEDTSPQSGAEDALESLLPDSVLYYGEVGKIILDENGSISALRLSSEKYGNYVMNLSEGTVWIDSGERTVSDPATLAEGERLYIFHSSISTQSMPPQSSAYAIVRNIPQDAGCAQYMKVDSVEMKENSYLVTANHGTVQFTIDSNTTFSPYRTKNIVRADDIQENSRIMVWYTHAGTNEDLSAFHIMLLPGD